MPTTNDDSLGVYLKGRRARLDPAALGFPLTRRRTPGLRREEVAQRANVSTTWYTWLEQGRGGAPSADTLDRIAHALMLTDVEREYLFLLALGRLPEARYRTGEGVTPRLQRLVDALELSPAFVRTSTWDVVAWNRAVSAVLIDYGSLAPEERNILRVFFCDPRVRDRQPDWEGEARFLVAAFRADSARAGATREAEALIDDLRRRSPEFDAMWRDNDVRNTYGEAAKQVQDPRVGTIALDYSTFVVDGRPDLGLVVLTPATLTDADRVRTLMDLQSAALR